MTFLYKHFFLIRKRARKRTPFFVRRVSMRSCELIEKAIVSSLHIRRQRTMAIETFNVVNILAPVYLQVLLNVK